MVYCTLKIKKERGKRKWKTITRSMQLFIIVPIVGIFVGLIILYFLMEVIKFFFDKLSDALIVAENWENENGDEVWVCGVIDKYPYYEKVVKI